MGIQVVNPEVVAQRFRRFIEGGDADRVLTAAGQEVVRDLIKHVGMQRAITDTGELPPNASSTLARKAKEGKAGLSLVDEGNLLRPKTYVVSPVRDNAIEISRSTAVTRKGKTADYNEMAEFWWFKPDPPKYNWWGISPTVQAWTRGLLLQFWRALFK